MLAQLKFENETALPYRGISGLMMTKGEKSIRLFSLSSTRIVKVNMQSKLTNCKNRSAVRYFLPLVP